MRPRRSNTSGGRRILQPANFTNPRQSNNGRNRAGGKVWKLSQRTRERPPTNWERSNSRRIIWTAMGNRKFITKIQAFARSSENGFSSTEKFYKAGLFASSFANAF